MNDQNDTTTPENSERESVESTDPFTDLKELENGERIKDGDVFLWNDKLYPATDIGSGVMSNNHFPHFRLANSE